MEADEALDRRHREGGGVQQELPIGLVQEKKCTPLLIDCLLACLVV